MNKSIVAWVGGKAKLMWIINLLAPVSYGRSVDIFGGSGTVTLNLDCPPSTLKIYNDFNAELVNLMNCAKNKPLALTREIGFLALNSRADFEMFKKFIAGEEFREFDLEEELELTQTAFQPLEAEEIMELLKDRYHRSDVKRAAAYYKILRYSFNANADTYGGRKCDVRRFFTDIWDFARQFSNVTVENKDFDALIKQYDRESAFLYADPPYYDAEGFYKNISPFTKNDHIRLRDTLTNAKGYVMVSYNNAPEIIELYQDFYIFLTTRPNSMSKKEGDLYEELIITNYDPSLHLQYKHRQISLFGELIEESTYTQIHKPEKALKI